jgi:hypothetical protein
VEQLPSERFEVYTVHYLGWSGEKDRELLTLMDRQGFDCLITSDRRLHTQQNTSLYKVCIVVLVTANNRFEHIAPHIEVLVAVLENLSPDVKVVEVQIG